MDLSYRNLVNEYEAGCDDEKTHKNSLKMSQQPDVTVSIQIICKANKKFVQSLALGLLQTQVIKKIESSFFLTKLKGASCMGRPGGRAEID